MSDVHDENTVELKKILRAASECIANSSLLDFTIDDVAEKAEVSISVMQLYVTSKEDILAALVIHMSKHFYQSIKEIMELPLYGPERLIAMFLTDPLKTHNEAIGVDIRILLGNRSVINNLSSDWQKKIIQIDESFERLLFDSINNDNEFTANKAKRYLLAKELVLAIWSMYIGFEQTAFQQNIRNLQQSSLPLPFPLPLNHALVTTAQQVINAYPWASPLTMIGISRAASLMEYVGYR